MSNAIEIVKPKRRPPPLEERTPRVVITPETEIRRVIGDDGLEYTFVGDKAVCGAKVHAGRYDICVVPPRIGRNRCRKHGGNTPRGMSSKRFTTGKYSRDLPSRLAQRYEESLSDPNLLELNDDIAAATVRVSDLMQRLDTGESLARWKALRDCYDELKEAFASQNWGDFVSNLNRIGVIIDSAVGDYAIWSEIGSAITLRKSLIESKQKVMHAKDQMITSEQAMALMAFVISTVKNNVHDPKALTAITTEISAYLNRTKQLNGA